MELDRSWGASMRYVELHEDDLCCMEGEISKVVGLNPTNIWWTCVLECKMSVSDTCEMSGIWPLDKGFLFDSKLELFGTREDIDIGSLDNDSTFYALVFRRGVKGK